MINTINGTITAIGEQSITIMVYNIGFAIHVPSSQSFTITKDVQLFIHMHWHQENGPTLYGFATQLEKEIFLLITDCSGIGPKIGLAILTDLGATHFMNAVQQNNVKALSSVSGIGAKKAEQLMVHARHGIEKIIARHPTSLESNQEEWHNVSQVLQSLHYSRTEITQALTHIRQQGTSQTFDQLVRSALTYLSKRI